MSLLNRIACRLAVCPNPISFHILCVGGEEVYGRGARSHDGRPRRGPWYDRVFVYAGQVRCSATVSRRLAHVLKLYRRADCRV